MNIRPVFAGFLALVILFAVCGCHSEPEPALPTIPPDNLMWAAQETHVGYMKAVQAGREKNKNEIPPQYWAKKIQALKPLKVYTHRVNVVVVQRVRDGIEEGKYIYIPISSYIPMEGIDGFEYSITSNSNASGSDDFDPFRDGVYDYKRTIDK